MGNEISIAGFGQCGSQIALEISASFDPKALFNIEGLPHFKFSFSFNRIWRRSYKDPDAIKFRPNIYIGDLNAGNGVYNNVYKTKLLKEYFIKEPTATPKQAILAMSRNAKARHFRFSEEDEKLAQKIKNDPSFVDSIEALQFQSGNVPLVTLGGAGGIQFLSELIATKDPNIIKEFPKQADGMLVGIFSVGGGTGAGSLYHILSAYKKATARYTVGIGILPEQTEDTRMPNAGRFLVKYLSASVEDRFDTLFLFSNRAAYMALRETSGMDRGKVSREIVNSYIIEFAHDFSLLNDVGTRDVKGKSFDYMDGKNYYSGICFVGYSNADSVSSSDLFIRAISPLAYDSDALSGLSVMVTESRSTNNEIGENIERMFRGLLKGEDVDAYRTEINTHTQLYRTIKYVTVNYFCQNPDFSKSVDDIAESIQDFFRLVTQSRVQVNVNVFVNRALKRNSCQVIVVGSLSYEIYEYTFSYVKDRFFPESTEDFARFEAQVGDALGQAFAQLTPEQLKSIRRDIESTVTQSGIADQEIFKDSERNMIEGNEIISKIIGENDLRSVLLTSEHVRRALSKTAELGATFKLQPPARPRFT